MRAEIYKNSNVGGLTFLLELICTMIFVNTLIPYYGIKIHPAIRLVGSIIIVFIIFTIAFTSKIGCIIIGGAYSVLWMLLAYTITKKETHGDKIWMYVISGIIFLISFGIHMSLRGETGANYTLKVGDEEI
ncbi:hypothetical protein [Clostridium neonatale]|uniref:hypothetical protein n=1 Tax=Clostridium neonatale TaxID=137838 RepID=UPI00291B9669|nr:conserved membrane hypothetical protein [Clostridium neonatale]